MSNILRPPLLKRWKLRSRAAARLLAVGTASALCFGTLGTLPASAQPAKPFDHYLFASFHGGDDGGRNGEQIWLSVSKANDPFNWYELNYDAGTAISQPILQTVNPPRGQTGLRDPSLIRSADGEHFYLLATDLKTFQDGQSWNYRQSRGSRNLIVYESDDLVHWSEPRFVKIEDDHAGNVWAPEAFYDAKTGQYIVFWASNLLRKDNQRATRSALQLDHHRRAVGAPETAGERCAHQDALARHALARSASARNGYASRAASRLHDREPGARNRAEGLSHRQPVHSKPAPRRSRSCSISAATRARAMFRRHGAWFAANGIAALVMDNIEMGEVEFTHHGVYSRAWFHWYSRGFSPLAVELLNARRAVDYLAARPDLDRNRIGATGRSGGGMTTFFLAALDDRIKASAPVSGTLSTRGWVNQRLSMAHCDCQYPVNSYGLLYSEVGALIAPRAQLLANADADRGFPMDAFNEMVAKMGEVYRLYDASDALRTAVTPGGHTDTEAIRLPVYSFFLKEFLGIDTPRDERGTGRRTADRRIDLFPKWPAD